MITDTTPAAEAKQVEILRQMSPAQKLGVLAQLVETGITLALTGLRERFPAAAQWELQRRLYDMLLGEELAAAVYGPLDGHHDNAD